MSRTRVVVHGGKAFNDVFDRWATNDGQKRIDRVLSAAESLAPVVSGEYKSSLHTERVEHPTRPVLRVMSDVDYAMSVEANHGVLAKALDAAR